MYALRFFRMLFTGFKAQRLKALAGPEPRGWVSYERKELYGRWKSGYAFDLWLEPNGQAVWWWRSFDRVVDMQRGKWGVLLNEEWQMLRDPETGTALVVVELDDNRIKTFSFQPRTGSFGEEWRMERLAVNQG